MSDVQAPYSGTDNLEVMTEAVNYNRFLLSLVLAEAKGCRSILDFGAGIGTFARSLVESGYHVRCVEPDEQQAATIAAAGIQVCPSLEAVEDSSLDLIYTFNVLEHIEDDVSALALCRRKLRPGGRILVYVPAFQMLYSSMDRKVGHFRRYTRSQLAEKLRAAGFEVRRSEYVDCLGFLASLVYKAVGSDTGEINRSALVTYDRLVFPMSRAADFLLCRLIGKNVHLTAVRAGD